MDYKESLQDDERFMREALKEAKKAFDRDEVPVGAVLVYEGKIIARGFNQVEMLKDATAHAEMLCLTSASSYLENWRLTNTTLYCTLEPCCMCAGALMLSRISTLVWAAPDLRLGANGSFVDLFDKKHPFHSVEVRKGILESQSSDLMREFFQLQRKKKNG